MISNLAVIAVANIKRFVRNRSFLVLGLVAPFALMAALSVTIGSAFGSVYVPELLVADELGDGTVDVLVSELADSGFGDIDIVATEDEARQAVEDGVVEAAIVFRSDLAVPGVEPTPIVVLSHADTDAAIATDVASGISRQVARGIDHARLQTAIGVPVQPVVNQIEIVEEQASSRILTDETYFAVAMSAYFAVFVATALAATLHEDRRNFTLARMLGSPIGRFTPLAGKAMAVGGVVAVALALLVVSSSILLGADWGPPVGVVAIGVAICVAAVGVSLGVVSITRTEQAAGQVGAMLATAWAIFGGVFLVIPPTGLISGLSRFSPFSWALNGIGINAGEGVGGDVFLHALVIAAFGLVGALVAAIRRRELVRVS